MAEKPWEGRFKEKTAACVEKFSSSIRTDSRMYAQDIEGSKAHARMLGKQNIITEAESLKIVQGLDEIRTEIETGRFVYEDRLEDIHMHIETRLTEKIGDAAKKLHTARSRNDQVALDARLYLRDETHLIMDYLVGLRDAIVSLAEKNKTVVVAGYTHLQRAQPVLLAHHLLAYYEMFTRDQERFRDALKRINVMPLGSAALAGTTYPIDREFVAALLHFPEISKNSMDAVSDRDFMVEFLSAASITMMHLSRFSEELILWSSREFSFIEISDGFTTGSSIMPQKKNPDIPELVRGKTGRVYGALFSLLTLMKSLPLAYNRDMQEDKPQLFDAIDTLKASLDIYIRMLPEITVNKERMEKSTTTGFINATDMADYLAAKGMPFREAHSVTGKAVGYALGRNKELQDLSFDEMKTFSALISEDIFEFLKTEQVINRRKSKGGTASENVQIEITVARTQITKDQKAHSTRK